MVSLMINEQLRKAIKNAYLANDEEIDKMNSLLVKEHPTLISITEDEEFHLLDDKLKILIYHLIGNSDTFPFSDIVKFSLRGFILDIIKTQ